MKNGRCSGCGAVRRDDGWTWHPSACPVGGNPLSKEAQRRIEQTFKSWDESQRRALEGARTYVIG